MRASEIFESSKKIADVDPMHKETMPPTMVVPDMANPYEWYRFLIAIAGHPSKADIPHESKVKDIPYIAPFTTQEHDAVISMLKLMGKHPDHITVKRSVEPEDTHKSSPVRAYKEYQE